MAMIHAHSYAQGGRYSIYVWYCTQFEHQWVLVLEDIFETESPMKSVIDNYAREYFVLFSNVVAYDNL